MPYFVDRLRAPSSSIELVRNVENKCVAVAHVAVSVDDSWRHDHENRIVFTYSKHFGSLREAWSVFPKVQLVTAVNEGEPVALLSVLVRPAGHTGVRIADISHLGHEVRRQSIRAK